MILVTYYILKISVVVSRHELLPNQAKRSQSTHNDNGVWRLWYFLIVFGERQDEREDQPHQTMDVIWNKKITTWKMKA